MKVNMDYEDRLGLCEEYVTDHTYRVVQFRRCRFKAKWKITYQHNGDGDLETHVKKLCTKHKNEYLKFAETTKQVVILSVEKI